MLALTHNASLAIEGILSAPTVPDGAGIRIAPAPEPEGASGGQLQVTIAGAPADTDQVIDDAGARVFVDESIAALLDDKVLDANVAEEQVSFELDAQDSPEASPPSPNGLRDV